MSHTTNRLETIQNVFYIKIRICPFNIASKILTFGGMAAGRNIPESTGRSGRLAKRPRHGTLCVFAVMGKTVSDGSEIFPAVAETIRKMENQS